MSELIKHHFIEAGFTEDEADPEFPFFKNLPTDEEIAEKELEGDDIPKLLYGESGSNSGFCIWTGMQFIWFNASTIAEAEEFADKITAFEEPF